MNLLSKKYRLMLKTGVGGLIGLPLPSYTQGAYPNR